jgi:hypothetical protein
MKADGKSEVYLRTKKPGALLIIRHGGDLERIENSGKKLVWDKLPYESRIHIAQAIANKELEEYQPAAVAVAQKSEPAKAEEAAKPQGEKSK